MDGVYTSSISKVRPLPCLVFGESVVGESYPPDMQRPEPYGFPIKEGCYFRADDKLPVWERWSGWHDWAVELNHELGRLQCDARACVEGRHPFTQVEDGKGPLTFAEQLMVGLPQFLLSFWELQLNGWSRLIPDDEVSRLLLNLRQRQSVGAYRSAVDAAFVEAASVARILEQHPVLRNPLAELRQRHARYHAAHPWCWLRFFVERHHAFDIMAMLQREAQQWSESRIVTPDRIRHARWLRAAEQRLSDLMGADPSADRSEPLPSKCTPGFDWVVTCEQPVDVKDLAGRILGSLSGYDEALITNELGNEAEYVNQWMVLVDSQYAEQHAQELAEAEAEVDALAAADLAANAVSRDADRGEQPGAVTPAVTPPPKTPARARVSEAKVERALEFIRQKPGSKAVIIAGHIDVGEPTFRSNYVPVLKDRGVKNDGEGYYIAAS